MDQATEPVSHRKLWIAGAIAVIFIVAMIIVILTSGFSGSKVQQPKSDAAAAKAFKMTPGSVAQGKYQGPVIAFKYPDGASKLQKTAASDVEEVRFVDDGDAVTVRGQPAVVGETLEDIGDMYSKEGGIAAQTKINGKPATAVSVKESGNSGVVIFQIQNNRLLFVMVLSKQDSPARALKKAQEIMKSVRATSKPRDIN